MEPTSAREPLRKKGYYDIQFKKPDCLYRRAGLHLLARARAVARRTPDQSLDWMPRAVPMNASTGVEDSFARDGAKP